MLLLTRPLSSPVLCTRLFSYLLFLYFYLLIQRRVVMKHLIQRYLLSLEKTRNQSVAPPERLDEQELKDLITRLQDVLRAREESRHAADVSKIQSKVSNKSSVLLSRESYFASFIYARNKRQHNQVNIPRCRRTTGLWKDFTKNSVRVFMLRIVKSLFADFNIL